MYKKAVRVTSVWLQVMGYWIQRNIYSSKAVNTAIEGLPAADVGSQKVTTVAS